MRDDVFWAGSAFSHFSKLPSREKEEEAYHGHDKVCVRGVRIRGRFTEMKLSVVEWWRMMAGCRRGWDVGL